MTKSLHNIMCLLITALPIICANNPTSLTASEMQFASVNDSVTLWCSLSHKHHLPENVKIEWFDGPLPIKTGLNGIIIKHTKTNAKLESQMIIDEVENFHFGQYNCKSTGKKGQLLMANTFLLPKGTNDDGKNLITNINLTHAGQVPLKCNNIPPENNNVSWKKVQFNQTVVSLDDKADSFNATISSLSETGKYVCYDDNAVFQISYVYPQDYHLLRFTENLPNNATLVFNNTNGILLTCTVPSMIKHTKLYWIFNNEIMASDVVKRVHVPTVIHTESGYELQLLITSPIPKMDAGTYTCVAENKWEKIERHYNIKFNIKTDDPFTITSFTSQECMIDGAEFTASCVIRFNKGIKPNVLIFHSNTLSNYPTKLVEDTNTHLQLTTDMANHVVTKTVTIKNASVKNNGTYYCIVLNFDGDPIIRTMTTQFIKRPVEIVKYYKDPIEKHSITCKAHVFATLFMNSTTIKFTHTNHGYNAMYDPTSVAINTTDKSITAHLDLNSVHDHHKHHGVYICTTSASLLDKPDKIYSDSRDLTLEHTTTKKQASVMEFSVQSSETDQSSNDTPTTETVYIVVGVTVVVVATAVLVFAVVHQKLRRSKHSLLNQPQYV